VLSSRRRLGVFFPRCFSVSLALICFLTPFYFPYCSLAPARLSSVSVAFPDTRKRAHTRTLTLLHGVALCLRCVIVCERRESRRGLTSLYASKHHTSRQFFSPLSPYFRPQPHSLATSYHIAIPSITHQQNTCSCSDCEPDVSVHLFTRFVFSPIC